MKNLLLVSLDTVRADIAYSGCVRQLDEILSRGTCFDAAFALSPLTPVSHATVMSGRLPKNHGVRHLYREQIRGDIPLLAELLKQRGFQTGGFVSCAGMDRWYGFARGFEEYDDHIPLLPDGRKPVETSSMELRGKTYRLGSATAKACRRWLETLQPQLPFFCFLHFFDAHLPYDPPSSFASGYEHPYVGELAFAVSELSGVLQDLDRLGRLHNTLIVIFGDHGEDLGEHGSPSGLFLYENGHGALLTDVAMHVPLCFIGQGIPELERIQEQVSLVDVFPTILELLGVYAPAAIDGASLAGALHGQRLQPRVAWMETYFPEELASPVGPLPALHGIRWSAGETKFKTIWSSDGVPVAVFDLANDPSEQCNLLLTGAKGLASEAHAIMPRACVERELKGPRGIGPPE